MLYKVGDYIIINRNTNYIAQIVEVDYPWYVFVYIKNPSPLYLYKNFTVKESLEKYSQLLSDEKKLELL